jgi:hypothetical protein
VRFLLGSVQKVGDHAASRQNALLSNPSSVDPSRRIRAYPPG